MALSENYKYKSPDITGLVENVKRMMGVDSGAAGRRSRNMSDFLTGAKTEGQQLKNIGLNNKNQAFIQAIDSPEMQKLLGDLAPLFAANPANASSIASGYSTAKSIPEVLAKKKAEASLAEEKVGKDALVQALEKRIFNYGKPGTSIPEYYKQVGRPTENEFVPRQKFTEEELDQLGKKLAILRGDKRTSAAANLPKIEAEAGKAKTSFAIELKKLEYLPKEQAEKLKNLENITKTSEKKIKVQEEKVETEKDRQELIEARTQQVKDLRAEKVLILKAKGKAQKEKNDSLVRELEAKRKELDLKIEVQEEKLKTERTKGKTAESKLEKQKLETQATPEILRQKLEKTGLEIKRLAEQLKGDMADSERKKIKTELAEKTKEFKITKAQFEAFDAEDKNRLTNERLRRSLMVPKPTTKNTSTSTGDSDWDDLEGKTTPTTATPQKGQGKDPVAMEIFNSLMTTVEPEVLRSWTPEEADQAVAMIKQKHPNMNEERIRRLIQTAQRRSQ